MNIDYASTIVYLIGAPPLPEAQGRSLRPLLSGEAPAELADVFFSEYFKEGNFSAPTVLAVRIRTYKLIIYPRHDEWTELFNETKNLAGDAAPLASLRREFDAQAKAVAFRMPEGVPAPDAQAPKPAKKKKKAA